LLDSIASPNGLLMAQLPIIWRIVRKSAIKPAKYRSFLGRRAEARPHED
jgi:hypothetical protein